jgi:hypothetical protein
MKIYHGHLIYRGCAYDFKVCAKSMVEVSKVTDISIYECRNYFSCGGKINPEDEFEGIIITPYGHRCVEVLGLTRGNLNDEMPLEEFKQRIDLGFEEYWKNQK